MFLKKHILMDWRVVRFLTNFQYQLANNKLSVKEKVNLIRQVIKQNGKLKITYLKTNDEKSKRLVKPESVGQMEYLGKKYLGMEAYCFMRRDNRVFRIDRILELSLVAN